jgi:hypothetical protein
MVKQKRTFPPKKPRKPETELPDTEEHEVEVEEEAEPEPEPEQQPTQPPPQQTQAFVSRPDLAPLSVEAATVAPEQFGKDGQGSQSPKVIPPSSIAVASPTVTALQTQVLTYQAQTSVDRQHLNDIADRVRNANDAILAHKGTPVAR